MAIIKMDKIRLYVHKSVTTDVFNVVQKLGIVEFIEVQEEEKLEKEDKTIFEFNYASSRLDFAVEFLSKWEKIEKRKDRIKRAIEGNKIFVDEKEITETANTFYFNDIVDSVQDLEEKMNDVDSKLKNLEDEGVILQNWINFDVELSTHFETEKTKVVFLTGEEKELETLSQTLKEAGLDYDTKSVNEEHFIGVFFKKDLGFVTKAIAERDLEILELPKRRGTPTEELERIDRAIKKAEKTKTELEAEAVELSKNLPKLKIVSDHIFWKKEKHNLLSSAAKKNEVLIFEGWCPEKYVEKLEKEIGKEAKLFVLEKRTPEEGETPPVEIENGKLVTPFETITRLYGLPGSKDLDPTPFLAGFFFIFFGLSLTDVGYGLLLFLVSAALFIFFKIPKGAKPLLALIMIGGVSSFTIGMLFGGYLGIDMDHLPEWAQKIQMFDPIANPLPVFYMALAFGVIQIIFGLILKIVRDAKIGMLKNGILDQGPWLALFFSLMTFGASKAGLVLVSSPVPLWLIYGSLISLVITQGRKEDGIVKKLAMGVLSLYESINFFSDVLSYSRLLALGLATSALAFAVNLIAGMVSEVPYVGGILVATILVVGHLFNLAVNLLGAFIHSARLQFVEFFGKFITDSGRNFNPFKREERYIVVK